MKPIKLIDYGFLQLLTILFIGLKLAGYIDWYWLWVLSPIWVVPAVCISFAILVFSVFIAALIGALVIAAITDAYLFISKRINSNSDLQSTV